MTEKYFTVNAEKQSIRCKLYCDSPKDMETMILFGHGFGGHMDNKAAARLADRVLRKNKNAAVMTFNWPCHGEDVKKKLVLDDCSAYLRLLLDYIRERWDVQNLYGNATSFGGYLFLRYIAQEGNPFRRIALRCPAVNMYEALTNTIMSESDREGVRKGKKALVGFDRKIEITSAFLDALQADDVMQYSYTPFADDILILHGTEDEIIPFRVSEAFAEKNRIRFIPFEGADHRFLDPRKMDAAIAQITDFFGLK